MKNLILLFTIFSLSAISAFAQPFAYVPNFSGGDVSVVNLGTNAVVTTITVGNNPFSAATSNSTQKVYVANRGSNTISVIDVATNMVEATIDVGTEPQAIVLSEERNRLYVPNKLSNSLTIINTTDNSIEATVNVGGNPYAAAINPSDDLVYVSNQVDESLSVIDMATNTVINTIAVGGNIATITFNPAGTKAYITDSSADVIKVIDLSNNMVTNTIPVGDAPVGTAIGGTGFDKLYVANRFDGTISVIDLATEMVENTITTGGEPLGLAPNADGSIMYSSIFSQGTLVTIDLSTNMVTNTNTVGNGPWSLGDFILDFTVPPGDNCDIAIDINSLFGQAEMMPQLSDQYNHEGYSFNDNDPTTTNCGWSISNFPTIWYSFMGDGNRYSITSTGTDVAATIYSGACSDLTEIACNDDNNGTDFGFELQTEEGVTYLVSVIHAFQNETGNFNIEVTNLGTVGVQDIQNTAIQLYPNPTTDFFKLEGIDATRILVFDQVGRQVAQFSQPAQQMDIQALPAGVYALRIENADGQVYSARIVKK